MTTLKIIWIVLRVILIAYLLIGFTFGFVFYFKVFKRAKWPLKTPLMHYEDLTFDFPRKEVSFYSGLNRLSGYIYGEYHDKGVIIYHPGMCPAHDGYLSDIIALVNLGYQVFTYDVTGTGNSEGKDQVGFNQGLKDLKAALAYVSNNPELNNKPVFLYGHSWGGYAVTAVLRKHQNIKGVVSVSGFDSPLKIQNSLLCAKSKGTAVAFYPITLLFTLFEGGNHSASKALKKTSVPVLVIQGANDEIVKSGISIYGQKDKINNPHVSYYLETSPLHSNHNTILASDACVNYQKEIQKRIDEALKEGHDKNKALDKVFSQGLDKMKYNSANQDLMGRIDAFYQECSK